MREVKEETGLTLTSYRFRGIVTFVCEGCEQEFMCLYTADGYTGTLTDCDEGELEWIDKNKVCALPIWEGDKLFFELLARGRDFFSLKLVYDAAGNLTEAVLDGKKL